MTQQLKDLIAKLVPDAQWRNILEAHINIEIGTAKQDGYKEALADMRNIRNNTGRTNSFIKSQEQTPEIKNPLEQ